MGRRGTQPWVDARRRPHAVHAVHAVQVMTAPSCLARDATLGRRAVACASRNAEPEADGRGTPAAVHAGRSRRPHAVHAVHAVPAGTGRQELRRRPGGRWRTPLLCCNCGVSLRNKTVETLVGKSSGGGRAAKRATRKGGRLEPCFRKEVIPGE
jgi:hypothetical protein